MALFGNTVFAAVLKMKSYWNGVGPEPDWGLHKKTLGQRKENAWAGGGRDGSCAAMSQGAPGATGLGRGKEGPLS